jgi:hypothetical protein
MSLLALSSGFQRRSFSAFCPRYSRDGPILHSFIILIVLRLFVGWGAIGSPDCLGANFVLSGGYQYGL